MLFTNRRYKYLADIIMPNSCALCGKVIVWDRLVCDECSADMPREYTEMQKFANIEGAVSAFYYEDKIISRIYRLKNDADVNNFAELSALKIAERLCEQGLTDKIDVVTAVPMHIRKKLVRGRNQAELLARFVADAINRPTDFSMLARISDKTEQHKLMREERAAHARKIYIANRKHSDIRGKTVLICDDVITTGSTISACGGVLKELGASEVYACSAAVSVK